MKTLVISAIHGRKELTQIWMDHCKRIGLDVVLAYTNEEDKPEGEYWSVKSENEPLAEKWQLAVNLARIIGADRYLILGSDDFMSERIWDSYQDFDFFGFKDMFFWWLHDNMSYYFKYHEQRHILHPNRAESIGAGQMYSHELLEKIDFKIFDPSGLAEGKRPSKTYLDQIGEHQAREHGTFKATYMGDKRPLIMSPKILNCMHPVEDHFVGRMRKVDGGLFLGYFPVETLQAINHLSEKSRTEAYDGIPLPKRNPARIKFK